MLILNTDNKLYKKTSCQEKIYNNKLLPINLVPRSEKRETFWGWSLSWSLFILFRSFRDTDKKWNEKKKKKIGVTTEKEYS